MPNPVRTRTFAVNLDDLVPEEIALSDLTAEEEPLATPPPVAATRGMIPPSTIGGDPNSGMTEEAWAALTPSEKARNVLQWGGKVISGMTGMGSAGKEALEHPKTTLALAAAPIVIRGAQKMIPSATRAGRNFQEVMAKTKDVPVDISGPGNQALRLQELAERGGSMPKVARDFIKRVTDPEKSDLTYKEARDFYSNLSRLSADEFKRLTPAMKREIGAMRVALNKSLEGATARTDSLPQYQRAMREYARASHLREVATKAAKWGAGIAGGGAAYRLLVE